MLSLIIHSELYHHNKKERRKWFRWWSMRRWAGWRNWGRVALLIAFSFLQPPAALSIQYSRPAVLVNVHQLMLIRNWTWDGANTCIVLLLYSFPLYSCFTRLLLLIFLSVNSLLLSSPFFLSPFMSSVSSFFIPPFFFPVVCHQSVETPSLLLSLSSW